MYLSNTQAGYSTVHIHVYTYLIPEVTNLLFVFIFNPRQFTLSNDILILCVLQHHPQLLHLLVLVLQLLRVLHHLHTHTHTHTHISELY